MKCMSTYDAINFLRYESTKTRIENRINQLYDLYDVLEDDELKQSVIFKIRSLEHKLNKLKTNTRI